MLDKILYYLDLLATLCGFDGSNNNTLFGWFVITVATVVVIYAFYQGITKMIWPGEAHRSHIKYSILNDSDMEQDPDAN